MPRVGATKHDAADFDRPDPAFPVESDGQRFRRVLLGGEVRREGPAVDVDRVSSDRLDYRHARRGERFAESPDLPDAEGEIVVV